VIIAGIAEGMWSVWCPVVVVCIATLMSFAFAAQFHINDVTWFCMGLYGIGIAAVGMLSTLGLTLATDAYGPIADNAGGNAEMAGLEPFVRERTDALDSLGNTTAATGKGFAIGSAALTALALLAAYVEEVRVGFERWGTSAVTQLAKQSDFKPGYYKLNEQFVVGVQPAKAMEKGYLVQYKANDDGKDYTDFIGKHSEKIVKVGDKNYACSTFLVMPEQLLHKGTQSWKDVKLGNGPIRLSDDGLVQTLAPEKVGGIDKPRASFGDRDELTSVEWASMMDWMNYYSCNLMNPKVLVGMFLGAMATFIFCALTMKAVGRAARGMVEEVRRQFREFPGIMDYTQKPDYKEPVRISTQAAQREMIFPSVLGLALPVIGGLILGVGGVVGMLVGTLTSGFCLAVFMANAGGAWDNAKKYIESGQFGGKRSDPHKAAVVGDTVGDPFKDTSGPSLNILIKLMSMVSVVVAGFIVRCSLVAFGWF
jgi:inorganic pyrophosphatase/K(+)-stimulated pyrophosphate-energized sodium pump